MAVLKGRRFYHHIEREEREIEGDDATYLFCFFVVCKERKKKRLKKYIYNGEFSKRMR